MHSNWKYPADKDSCLWWPDFAVNHRLCVCVCVVQHGMVYQECDASGQWVTTKNTSECDSNDPSQVVVISQVLISRSLTDLMPLLEMNPKHTSLLSYKSVFICSSTTAIFGSCTQWATPYHWWLWCWRSASSYSSGNSDFQLKSFLLTAPVDSASNTASGNNVWVDVVLYSHVSRSHLLWSEISMKQFSITQVEALY